MNIAIAQMQSVAGAFDETRTRMLAFAQRAKDAGADLALFPAHVLTGGCTVDDVDQEGFVADLIQTLQSFAEEAPVACAIPIAGTTGGMAFVYGADGSFAQRANPESIVWQRLASAHWEAKLRELVEAHVAATDSKWAAGLLEDWDRALGSFWQVVPREMLSRLPQPLNDDAVEAVAAE